jgi:hypothetical protein
MGGMSKTLYPQGVLITGPWETLAIIGFHNILVRKIIEPSEERWNETSLC